MNIRTQRLLLALIIAAYALLGALYALRTPAWQAPDEPAHYNYVRYVAETGHLPVLRAGDYDGAYLEEIKARRFPPEMSIDSLRYEAHQPPLYYLLAAGVYRLAKALGAPLLLTLRLFSVLLGALGLLAGYRALHTLFPGDALVPLGAVALAAALPQHVAMTAAVNNDVFAELLVALTIGRALAISQQGWTARRAAGLGLLMGLAFLTKMQAYVAWAVAGGVLLRDAWRITDRQQGRAVALHCGGIALGVAGLVALSWLLRNVAVYGWADPLALSRHDLVVQGQPTTAALRTAQGLGGLLSAWAGTTFRSFWGQFGWMGVPMDGRVYQALALLSGLAAAGLAGTWAAGRRGSEGSRGLSRDATGVLLLWLGVTAAGYVWWNLRYVQHQGRYLFPALLAIGALGTVGMRAFLAAPLRRTLPLLAILAALIGAVGLARGDLPGYPLALVAGVTAGLALLRLLERVIDPDPSGPRSLAGPAVLTLGAGIWLLALWALFRVVLPALAA